AFLDALQSRPGRDRVRSDFLATLMFADLLPARHLAELIDARLVEYRRSLTAMQAQSGGRTSPGERFVHGYGIAMLEAALAYVEENRHLVESAGLLARKTSSAS
ncbi:MAG TPA: hypothetical protein VMU42_13610, partial [Candidatus Sulfotelmatobacter sp.]|nr:hypothetical protein [Candidatus Sulfotelmatobacter sp.]